MGQIISKSHIKISLVLKLISLIASVYGLIITSITTGLMVFTYYTTLSNVAVDVALLLFIIADIKYLTTGKNVKTNGMYTVKYVMTVVISLTFLIYMCILAPFNKDGFFAAYFNNYAGSFGVHFLGPVLAILDFILFDYNFKSSIKHVFAAIVPPLVYVVLVVILSSFGMRWSGNMHAPYNFLNFGAETGWFGWDLSKMGATSLGIGVAYMIVILVIFFLILGLIYLKIKDLRARKIAL